MDLLTLWTLDGYGLSECGLLESNLIINCYSITRAHNASLTPIAYFQLPASLSVSFICDAFIIQLYPVFV